MNTDTRRSHNEIVSYLHEILFSLGIAFFVVSLLFLAKPGLRIPFSHLEIRINMLLHIRQTDLIRGYFEYSIASLILAMCIIVLMQVSESTRATKEILNTISGVALILAPPIYWLCYYVLVGWPVGWPYRGAPFEITAVLVCVLLYFHSTKRYLVWYLVLILALHYAFWYWAPGTNPSRADYSGPIAPLLNFCAAMAWLFYRDRIKGEEVLLAT